MKLSPNFNIVLEVAGTGEQPNRYLSRVENVLENQIIVAAPIQDGSVVPVRLNSQVIIEYTIFDVKEQGRYRILGKVSQRMRTNNLAVLQIDLEGQWKKIQLRDYVRVDVLIDGLINKNILCLIKDLSGGGIRCTCKEELELNSNVMIEFALDDKFIYCETEVVRIGKENDEYQYGLAYINLDEETRKNIIQFVYQRQLENHRKVKKANFKEVGNDG